MTIHKRINYINLSPMVLKKNKSLDHISYKVLFKNNSKSSKYKTNRPHIYSTLCKKKKKLKNEHILQR